jgi:hypothetical protein
MSTWKYKATERYNMGWIDPRVVLKKADVYIKTLHPPGHVSTDYTDVPTETLKNLWLARFGGRAVTQIEMFAIREEQIAEVAQELMNRHQVSERHDYRADTDEDTAYYVLERTDGDS